METITCKFCGRGIKVDEYSIQRCDCGAYYRRKRGFEKGWTFAGWWKGGVSEKEKERQINKAKMRRRGR